MAVIQPTTWSSTATYSEDDKVLLNGVVYTALNSVAAGVSPTDSEDDWRPTAVHSITNRIGLIEAVKIYLNQSSNESITDSVPLFLQLAQESLTQQLRIPQQRTEVTLTVDSDSKVEIPEDLLEVINMYVTNESSSKTHSDTVEILAVNNEDYKRILESESEYYGYDYDSGYWYDGQYFWLAPLYPEGTSLTLIYNRTIPNLGETVYLTDDNGNAINEDGQTSAQWVAAGGTNTAENFEQATTIIESNWFLEASPRVLLYGTLLAAEPTLNNVDKVGFWSDAYEQAKAQLQDMVDRFETQRAQMIPLENPSAQSIY